MNEPKPRGQAVTYETGGYNGDPIQEIVQRLRRVETRASNAMRYVGIPPNEPGGEAGAGRVLFDGKELVCTGFDVPMRDITYTATKHGLKGPINVVVNNKLWGTYYAN